jgi:hypothetical protein
VNFSITARPEMTREHKAPKPSRGLALSCLDSSRREFLRKRRGACCQGLGSPRADVAAASLFKTTREPSKHGVLRFYNPTALIASCCQPGRAAFQPALASARSVVKLTGRRPLRCESAGELHADNFDRRSAPSVFDHVRS